MHHPSAVFDQAPFLAIWETTRACDLACKHCRASAVAERAADELTTREGMRLLDDVRSMGTPVVVLTGGDPAKRPDLVELVRYGNSIGLRMALTPSATPLVTQGLLEQLREAGLARLAVSLDALYSHTHDAFRGVAGSYDRTLDILQAAHGLGLTTQVNTTVSRTNVDDLEAIAEFVAAWEIELWSVFLVVPTGRARPDDVISAAEVESVLERLAALLPVMPFDIKTTAAPHFRRVLLQQHAPRGDIAGLADGIGRAPRSVNDGCGLVFVSHRGEVYPSGFLPLSCGNVRTHSLTEIYRENPLMRQLRSVDALEGKCGVCEFRRVCGGSRARAYAVTGSVMAAEPACAYVPRAAAS